MKIIFKEKSVSEKNVIIDLKVKIDDLNDETFKKEVLIKKVKDEKTLPDMETYKGNKVTLIKEKYFRTDANQDSTDDLLDLPLIK